VITLIIVGLGKLADRRIEDGLLPRYKRAMALFLTGLTGALWVRYNTLLKAAQTAQAGLSELRANFDRGAKG
jgi:hypothetical protein